MKFRRYAVFVTPSPGAFAEAAAAWLGWDAAAGRERRHPALDGLPAPVAEITAAPRRYGFHGTVKAPFALAEGASADDLAQALRAHCAGLAPVRLAGLEVAALGAFVALRPAGETGALSQLAAATVAGLDGFRAPPGAAELARRRAAGLTPAQEALLARWGYPFVMEEFRFHMTLTGPLAADGIDAAREALAAYLAPVLPAPFAIDALTLLGEGEDGRFREILRAPLGGGAGGG
ncbi:DUF1045 domain-containing protein [Rubrimonas cliftonensis]|uniref:Putative phosphonate metabolism protein n=1 Tax=Rubrimonas cliftonensis TaxID=89524 RepID=A0A1H3YS89_9RHOB|nr:DUF1045 domain-containing protein [Rubrimonas cliftonensis]SEA13928.1 putative phosphonate metabolism protein [Rubrimonas cliftonensis]